MINAEMLLVPASAVAQLREESRKLHNQSTDGRMSDKGTFVDGIDYALQTLGPWKEEGKS